MTVVLIFILFLVLYLFLISPRIPRRNMHAFKEYLYAHRGLWNARVPENSLAAFRAAVENGYGIELDVQLTGDHQLAVIHDHDLFRMCSEHVNLHDISLQEAKSYHLRETAETIPSLEEALQVISGRTPVIVEIKSCRGIRILCEKTAQVLDHYDGLFCVESFNPVAVAWFRKHRPAWFRGQLAFSPRGGKYPKKVSYLFLASLIQNVIGRPDFIAYDTDTEKNLPWMLVRHLFHPWTAGWTISSQEEYERCRTCYDLLIFEHFLPRT